MKEKKPDCPATMDSQAVPGHTHTCSGSHDAGDHYCKDCGRWFYEKPKDKK